MSTHIQVPLKNLRFGHEAPNHPSNARVTGRLDDVPALAANIYSRGQIEDLIVFDDGVPPLYFVSDGNRSLAALRLIHGEDRDDILIDCKVRPAEGAFEDSLAVAVTSRKLHPIDEYEGYAKLKETGKTNEEIAQQYGLTEHEVDQVLALGSLSPQVRDLWRKGELKTEVARSLPMVGDHKAQDALLKKLSRDQGEEGEPSYRNISDYDIKRELKIDRAGVLVEFVGIAEYVKAGGKVTRDLFGTDHKVSDAKLAKELADQRLARECNALVAAGWSFAVPADSVRNVQHKYTLAKVEEGKPQSEEERELSQLRAMLPEDDHFGDPVPFASLSGKQQTAFLRIRDIEFAIEARRYSPKVMAKAGCFVAIDDNGMLDITFGKVKEAEKKAAATEVKAAKKEAARAAAGGGNDAPAPEPVEISNALRERLHAQLVAATRDGLVAALDTDILKSPLAQILGNLVSRQITVNGSSVQIYSHGVSDKLAAMREALPADIINPAIAKRFDADDYFSNAPKAFLIRAIAETINPDEARKASNGFATKADLAKFALTNVGKSGWLPKELRTSHYVMPVVKGTAAAAAKAGAASTSRRPAKPTAKKKATGTPAKAVKRAAAAKKPTAKKSKR
ncbi:ParB/RepB/Spo0J family partition protein [Bradyrhizobium retamae]|uniref:ParB/Spo0J HTH domain-containing protein n=1 Tax=Bradyrhizobium retamae TaxID=1300035 RepID=A0A0R3N7G3_9BRAD|nr:hypothetical protein [Bradyrhizobium retamae]KRR25933.1 hypothetical protein CQ13_23195 [Bradyrhizobium retamae]